MAERSTDVAMRRRGDKGAVVGGSAPEVVRERTKPLAEVTGADVPRGLSADDVATDGGSALDRAIDERPVDDKPRVDRPKLATDVQRIVTRTFDLPAVDDVAAEIESKLKAIKPSRCEWGTLVDALDEAQENARLAMQLLVNAKLAGDRFDADATITSAAMRDYAMAKLQSEKDRGQRTKAITNDDIEAAMATHFPDEWQHLAHMRSQVKRTIAYLEDLCERMRERARDLRAMVSTSRA